MDATNPVPESISHRQLMTLLQTAVPDAVKVEAEAQGGRGQEFEALLRAYGQVSHRLLQELQKGDGSLAEGRSPRQLMAIGALQAHVHMALQALAASQS
jgi:hypothetical protein